MTRRALFAVVVSWLLPRATSAAPTTLLGELQDEIRQDPDRQARYEAALAQFQRTQARPKQSGFCFGLWEWGCGRTALVGYMGLWLCQLHFEEYQHAMREMAATEPGWDPDGAACAEPRCPRRASYGPGRDFPYCASHAAWHAGIREAQAELRAGLGQPYRWGVQR